MALKTFRKKDGSIIDVYCHKSFNSNHVGNFTEIFTDTENNCSTAYFYDWDEFMKVNKIIECFDERYLHNIQGNSNTIILENDAIVPDCLYNMAEYVSNTGFRGNIFQPFLDLSKSSSKEGYDKYLYEYIENNKIKNVFIDSIFKDRVQFENIAKNVFRWVLDVNIFINAHNTLLDILNEYTKDEEIKRVVTNMCNVYEIDVHRNIASKVDYDYSTSKFIHKTDYYLNFKY